MRLLLDTHIILWVLADHPALSKAARKYIDQSELVFASSVSLWEMHIKIALGKLNLNADDLPQRLADSGLEPLPVTWEHAHALGRLPLIHRDPFDRLLIAQAISEPLKFLTADMLLAEYSELIIVAK